MELDIVNDHRPTVSSIAEVNDYLYGLPTQVRTYEQRLEYVRLVLKKLGNPQNSAPAIHIAGTSGKGSTSYYSSSILVQAGYKVGLAVSPHVHSVKERAQINGSPLDDKTYLTHFNDFIDNMSGVELTYIEFLTVFAFWLFREVGVDYMVIEVGLGGLLDPTNVIHRPNTVRVITDIGYDHTDLLGDTLAKIASQKAGIIHESDTVVMHSQAKEVMDVVELVSAKKKATLTVALDDFGVDLTSLPRYQRRNWTLAANSVATRLALDSRTAASNFNLAESIKVNIPGRFERVSYKGVDIILDAAHNPQKISALSRSLGDYSASKKPVALVAFGTNKKDSVAESLGILSKELGSIIATEFKIDFSGGHTALPAADIASMCNGECVVEPELTKALDLAVLTARQKDTYVLATGSFYLLDNLYPLIARASRKT